jgi:nucleoid-associated protein YgaU
LPETYIVEYGDTLAHIAKKFYGSEEGNKKVNIEAIFRANRKTLKSPDQVYEGQKLTIPALALSETTSKKDGIFSGSIFQKVASIGRRHLSPDTSKQTKTRKYVVREGDNLWKIAAAQLGNGNRYTEIAQLNCSALESEDDLSVGMSLKLPDK